MALLFGTLLLPRRLLRIVFLPELLGCLSGMSIHKTCGDSAQTRVGAKLLKVREHAWIGHKQLFEFETIH